MAVTWKYAQNQFLRATGGSRPLMLSVASDHSAKLTAHLGSPPDPVIQQCLAGVQPAYDDFQLKVVTWNAISGTREGQTQMLDDLLDELRFIRVKQWNFTVQLTYLDGTPQYTQIFTDGLAPFNSGGKDERILAVQTLATRLAAFPEFASLKTSVETFYASLKSARDTQQGSEGQIKSASDAAEVSRVELAIELYGSLGLLMHKHRKQPQRLTDYFEVPLLRQGGGGSALPPADTGGDEPVLAVFSYGIEQVDTTT